MSELTFTTDIADFLQKHSPKNKVTTKISFFQKYFGVFFTYTLITASLLSYFLDYNVIEYLIYILITVIGTMIPINIVGIFTCKNKHHIRNSIKVKQATIALTIEYWNRYFINKQKVDSIFAKYDVYVVVAILAVCGFIIPATIYGATIYTQRKLKKTLKDQAIIIQNAVDAENDYKYNNAKDITPL